VKVKIFVVFLLALAWNCGNPDIPNSGAKDKVSEAEVEEPLRVGAQRTDLYLPMLRGKRVALLVNQTSRIGERHLVDSLLSLGVDIRRIFAPEHGFRGTADAGQKLTDGRDPQTGLEIISLYGSKRKPAPEDLAGLDWVIFDIQDVGARFYTYISSMHYVMEACAENGLSLMVLDRPNPNGHYVDGPVRAPKYRSFVGMHPVPVAHGMTVGEYARMINGEGWLEGGQTCALTVIPCENYDHQTPYVLPVRPSPNLPNQRSVYLYPSLCFFEGTVASVGRGTETPFQIVGHPGYPAGDYTFTPRPMPGARHPKLEGERCRGYDLTGIPLTELRTKKRLDLSYLIRFYRNFPNPDDFFLSNGWIDKLAGTARLRKMIVAGRTEQEIRASWEEEVAAFKRMREGYLLYD